MTHEELYKKSDLDDKNLLITSDGEQWKKVEYSRKKLDRNASIQYSLLWNYVHFVDNTFLIKYRFENITVLIVCN